MIFYVMIIEFCVLEESYDETIRRMREEALDSQYAESDDKLWACIPQGIRGFIVLSICPVKLIKLASKA
jgi:hypothetical protein